MNDGLSFQILYVLHKTVLQFYLKEWIKFDAAIKSDGVDPLRLNLSGGSALQYGAGRGLLRLPPLLLLFDRSSQVKNWLGYIKFGSKSMAGKHCRNSDTALWLQGGGKTFWRFCCFDILTENTGTQPTFSHVTPWRQLPSRSLNH